MLFHLLYNHHIVDRACLFRSHQVTNQFVRLWTTHCLQDCPFLTCVCNLVCGEEKTPTARCNGPILLACRQRGPPYQSWRPSLCLGPPRRQCSRVTHNVQSCSRLKRANQKPRDPLYQSRIKLLQKQREEIIRGVFFCSFMEHNYRIKLGRRKTEVIG